MFEIQVILILILSFMLVAAIFRWWCSRNQSLRPEALLRISENVGISFRKDGTDVLKPFASFSLLSDGIERTRNLLESNNHGCWRCLIDYFPLNDDGESQEHTICLIRSDRLDLPYFRIKPATWYSRQVSQLFSKPFAQKVILAIRTIMLKILIRWFNSRKFADPITLHPVNAEVDASILFQGTDVAEIQTDYEDLNSVYHIQGTDKAEVQSVFTQEVRDLLMSKRSQRFHCEAEGQTLLFHTSNLVHPDKVLEMFEESLQIISVFAGNR